MDATSHQTKMAKTGTAETLLAKSLLWGLPARLGVAAELRRTEDRSAQSGSAQRGIERKKAA